MLRTAVAVGSEAISSPPPARSPPLVRPALVEEPGVEAVAHVGRGGHVGAPLEVEELYLRHVPGLEVALGEPHAELGVLVATLDVVGGQTAEVGEELALGQQAGAAQRGHRLPLGGAVEAAVQALE